MPKITSYKQRKAKHQCHTATMNRGVDYTDVTVPKATRPAVSKYGYATNNSPEQTELTSVLRRGSRSSGRKITMLEISKGKSDE